MEHEQAMEYAIEKARLQLFDKGIDNASPGAVTLAAIDYLDKRSSKRMDDYATRPCTVRIDLNSKKLLALATAFGGGLASGLMKLFG